MGVHNADHVVKEKGRVSDAVVPSISGNYADQRLTFGAAKAGDLEQSFMGVTVLIESLPSGASIELWLPKVADGTRLAENRTDADYFFAGLACFPPRVASAPAGITASFGSATWPLAGYPGAQLRILSAGPGGQAQFSGSAF